MDIDRELRPEVTGRPAHRGLRPGPETDGRTEPTGGLGADGVVRLQRDAGNQAVGRVLSRESDERAADEPSPVFDVLASRRGAALPGATRALMESRFGQTFGDVRVHTDAQATESAAAVDAHAYTVGSDIVVRSDRWAPGTPAGDRLLAHELAHVVQQRSGPVDGVPAAGGIKVSQPGDPFERAAEQTADTVMQRAAEPAEEEEPEA